MEYNNMLNKANKILLIMFTFLLIIFFLVSGDEPVEEDLLTYMISEFTDMPVLEDNGSWLPGDIAYDRISLVSEMTDISGLAPKAYGDIIVFMTYEEMAFEDLNGDGYLDDIVIRYYNISSGEVFNTGIDGMFPSVYEDTIAFAAFESALDDDMNLDADIDDIVVLLYNISSGKLSDLRPFTGFNPCIYGDLVAFQNLEYIDGKDITGDGDLNDSIIEYHNLSSGDIISTGLEGMNPRIYGDMIVFVTNEVDVLKDLDNDTYLLSYLLRYHNIPSGESGLLMSKDDYRTVGFDHKMPYSMSEPIFGIDFSGDGDIDDSVIFYADLLDNAVVNTRQSGTGPFVTEAGDLLVWSDLYPDMLMELVENLDDIDVGNISAYDDAYIDGYIIRWARI